MFSRNSVRKTHGIWDIRLQKCRDLENRVRGPPRSLEMSKNIVTFKSGSEVTQGHWKLYQSVDRVWFPISVLNNFVPKMHRFWDIRLQKCCDLENRVRGASRSLEMSPCDRVPMTSYWCSIVTMALSRVVSDIFNVEKYLDLEIGVKGHSRSLKVVPIGRPCTISY